MASREIGVQYPKHTLWYRFFMGGARLLALPIVKRIYHIKTKKDKQEKPLPCILTYNHISNYDYICNVDMFRPYIRYIISDAMLRNKLNRIVYPIATDFIYRRKGERADDAVESVKVTIKAGLCVGVAPEGGVTSNGTTEPVRYKTGKMIKDCHCGMVTIAMQGGYFIYPTWSHYKAKGPMYGRIVGRYTKEQIEQMTVEEVNETIYRDIYVNHYEWNRKERIPYIRKNRAEWMERVTGICPKCKQVDTMKSEVDDLFCTSCGYRVTVDDYGFFNGDDVVFDNLYDWDMWQRRYLTTQKQKWLDNPDELIAVDEHMSLSVLRNNYPVLLEEDVRVEMDTKELRILGKENKIIMPIDKISGIVSSIADGYGIAYLDEYYSIKGDHPLWNDKFRFTRKLVIGESIGRDADGDIV